MTNEEAELTIDYLKSIQDGYIEGEGYEMHPLPEWYALDKAIDLILQTRWIPYPEKKPEEHKDVLIDVKEGEEHTFHITHLVDVNYWVRLGRDVNVVAWMPLPEPYKADMSGSKMSENPTGSN